MLEPLRKRLPSADDGLRFAVAMALRESIEDTSLWPDPRSVAQWISAYGPALVQEVLFEAQAALPGVRAKEPYLDARMKSAYQAHKEEGWRRCPDCRRLTIPPFRASCIDAAARWAGEDERSCRLRLPPCEGDAA